MGEQVLGDGDAPRATSIFRQIFEMAPDNADVISGLARALVADLTPARTESQLTGALDQLLAQLPIQGEAQQAEAELAPLIAMGEQVLEEGDAPRAASIFRQLLDMAPDNAEVIAGLARAYVGSGEVDEARTLLDGAPESVAADPAIARARSALELAAAAEPDLDTRGLESRIVANPDDLEARYEIAGALMGRNRDAAADQLFEIIGRDRDWNEGAARKRLLQLLEVVGLEDPWVSRQRRRLSAILFT
jgi:putative thioredoxin